jgi:hypothetical protein
MLGHALAVVLLMNVFAHDSWTSGKSAAVGALFALPSGLIVYGLTRLAAWITDSKLFKLRHYL